MEYYDLNKAPLVSVIMPSYNHKLYIEAAIKSVVCQSYGNFELIVIDDGSSDGSDELLKILAERYSFDLYLGRNGGLCKTLNKGLFYAKGKYIAIIASDDLWVHDKLERQISFMEGAPEVAACSGGHIKISSDGEPLPFYKQRFCSNSLLGFEDVFLWRGTLAGPLAMIRRDVLLEVSGYDEECVVEDWDVWLRITSLGYKLFRMSNVLGFYRVHGDNTYSNIESTEPSLLRSAAKFKAFPSYDYAVKKIYLRSFSILSSIDRRKAFLYLAKAFCFDFSYLKGVVKMMIPYSSK